jgi:hypothetical protein
MAPTLTISQPDDKNHSPARHRSPGDIMSEYRATSSRNAWATSSESAPYGMISPLGKTLTAQSWCSKLSRQRFGALALPGIGPGGPPKFRYPRVSGLPKNRARLAATRSGTAPALRFFPGRGQREVHRACDLGRWPLSGGYRVVSGHWATRT